MKNILLILTLALTLAALPALAQTDTPTDQTPAAENTDENPSPPPVVDEQGRIVGFTTDDGGEQPTAQPTQPQ